MRCPKKCGKSVRVLGRRPGCDFDHMKGKDYEGSGIDEKVWNERSNFQEGSDGSGDNCMLENSGKGEDEVKLSSFQQKRCYIQKWVHSEEWREVVCGCG